MRFSLVWTIFRKEIAETLRDRRTLIMMIGLPVVLYPLVVLGGTGLAETQATQIEARVSTVAVWGALPPELAAALGAEAAKLKLVEWTGAPAELRSDLETGRIAAPPLPPRDPPAAVPPGGTPDPSPPAPAPAPTAPPAAPPDPLADAARAVVSSREVDAVLVTWSALGPDLAGDRLGRLAIYYDSVRPDSSQARGRLRAELDDFRTALVTRREQEHALPPGFARGLDVASTDVAPPQRKAGHVFGVGISFLLILMSLMGGFYPSIDFTAGEKERGTMQTLLCAPLSAAEIICGKFLAVWSICLITGLANVASLAATFSRIVPAGARDMLRLEPSAYAITFLLFLPVSFITSAAFLAVGAFAKDFKDGQNLVTPVYMLFALPIGLTMLPGMELTPATSFAPVLNLALLIKALLVGEARLETAFLTLVSSFAYGALAILAAAQVFAREQVLLGGRESLRTTLGLERRPGGRPGPTFAFVFFSVMLAGLFYGSLWAEGRGVLGALLLVQYGLILTPTLGAVLGFGFPFAETFALRRPPARGLAAAALIGVSAWAAASPLVRLLPPPESLVKAMEKSLALGGEAPLWVLWLVVGLTPGLCEEALFRGLLLSGFRRLGKWPAILVTAGCFAVYHTSVYRLLPTFVLGALLGWLVWRTGSLACSVLAHALNNALIATLVRWEPAAQAMGGSGGVPLSWSVAGLVGVIAGVWLLRETPGAEGRGGDADPQGGSGGPGRANAG
ncbi:MAG: CPBP family intramembrane metalloprotease [Planctomycetes bacterium]|nr:CPBP family intramembrane metalloprotease [Planctomycetota bacterium]